MVKVDLRVCSFKIAFTPLLNMLECYLAICRYALQFRAWKKSGNVVYRYLSLLPYLQLLLVGRPLVRLTGEEAVVQPELAVPGPVVTAGLLRHLRHRQISTSTSDSAAKHQHYHIVIIWRTKLLETLNMVVISICHLCLS